MDAGFFAIIFSVALILLFAASSLQNKFFALAGGALFLLFGLTVMGSGVCFQDVVNTSISHEGYWEFANATSTCYPCNVNETCYGVEDDVNTTFGGERVESVGYAERCFEPSDASTAFGAILMLIGFYTVIVTAISGLRSYRGED